MRIVDSPNAIARALVLMMGLLLNLACDGSAPNDGGTGGVDTGTSSTMDAGSAGDGGSDAGATCAALNEDCTDMVCCEGGECMTFVTPSGQRTSCVAAPPPIDP